MPEYKDNPDGFGPEMFSFPYGGHVFVLARPKERDWKEFDGSTLRQGNDEFRPMMVRGHGNGQCLFAFGSTYGYSPEEFEFGPQLDLEDILRSHMSAGPRM